MTATPYADSALPEPDETLVDSADQRWHTLRQRRDTTLRQTLIDEYIPFARSLAAQLYAKRYNLDAPFEEYLQHALLGLIEATDKFDPTLGASFKKFAYYRIKGAILNALPNFSEEHAQVFFQARLRKEQAERAHSLLDDKPDRGKKNTQLFQEMVELTVGLSIGYLLEGTGMYASEEELSEHNDPYQHASLRQLRRHINALVEQLPQQSKAVIKYHYYFNMPFEEIADLLELSKGRISQIHKSALQQIKTWTKSDHTRFI